MFDRLITLIGRDKFSKLEKTNVLIVGIGGVGGYALEALIRSGIKNISIIDHDNIDVSNINRQIITSKNNIGQSKVIEAKKRALEINPDVNIKIFKQMLSEDNIDQILENKFNYIIDACDTISTKISLIEKSLIYKYKLISSMGAANLSDPSKISITKLSKTTTDPIAKILRRKIKDEKLKKKIMVVCSSEIPKKNQKLGTNSYIPGIVGLLCASYIINDITK